MTVDPWSRFLADPSSVPHDVLAESLRSLLDLKPSMHVTAVADPEHCGFCRGEAYALAKVRDRIRNMIVHSAEPSPPAEETPDG